MPAEKFRKRPVVIDAVQWLGDWAPIIAWLDHLSHAGRFSVPFGTTPPIRRVGDELHLTTVHGDTAIARIGDWVIPEPEPGRFYPCKPAVFEATYEPVPADPDGETPDV